MKNQKRGLVFTNKKQDVFSKRNVTRKMRRSEFINDSCDLSKHGKSYHGLLRIYTPKKTEKGKVWIETPLALECQGSQRDIKNAISKIRNQQIKEMRKR